MNYYEEQRITEQALYIIENGATVRRTAKKFGISKSTVHNDVTVKLKKIDGELYEKVRLVLNENKRERHIRGGNATREKYASRKKEQKINKI